MKILKLILTVSLFSTVFNLSYSQEKISYAKDQIIIKFRQNAIPNKSHVENSHSFGHESLDKLNLKNSITKIKPTGHKVKGDTYLLQFKNTQNVELLINEYLKTGLFEYVEPNFIGTIAGRQGVVSFEPSDTYFYRQYGLVNNGQFALSLAKFDADIDMELAWDIEKGSESIVVAVLDSGLNLDHPEFEGRLWTNEDEANNLSDDDSNGYRGDINGWDFVNDDNNPKDDHGHGTNVTGILGATGDNNIGYAGVDWNCKIMTCKILDASGYGFYSYWSEAIYYAVDNGADVINMSVGGSGFSNSLKTAVDYAYNNGVIIVASMMNFNNGNNYYPVAYSNVLSVGATDTNDERVVPFFWSVTSGSNYGNHINVTAPGEFMYGLDYNSSTNYDSYWGGTSQATPLVAGLCALLLSQDPSRTPDELTHIIESTSEDMVGKASEDKPGFDIYYGHGRVNAHSALQYNMITNTSEEEISNDWNIYPNPTNSDFSIDLTPQVKHINIVNTIGQKTREIHLQKDQVQLTIDISDLENGLYYLNLIDGQNTIIYTQQLIKE